MKNNVTAAKVAQSGATKRTKLVNKIKESAAKIYGGNVDVRTAGDIYPKCYIGRIGAYGQTVEQLTPVMLPRELAAYLYGITAGRLQVIEAWNELQEGTAGIIA